MSRKRKVDENLRSFYKLLFRMKPETESMWWAAALSEFFFLICAAVPFQEMVGDGELEVLMLMLGLTCSWLGACFYISPYLTFRDQTQNCNLADRLMYLPVDIRDIQKFCLIYLARFVGITFLAALLFQLLTSVGEYSEILWQNVVYMVVVGFLWPLLSNVLIILFQRAKYH